MKPILLVVFFICFYTSANCQMPASKPCAEVANELRKLADTANKYSEQKYFISANSYFKAAQQLIEQYDSCNIFLNDDAKSLALSIVAPATYQTLIESVLDLQDNANFDEATNKYKIAEKYFVQFQIANFGLTHDSLINFVFKKCKAGYAAWLAENYFNKKQLDLSLSIYKIMLEKGYDYKAMKRTLYDLGLQLAMRDKTNNASENAKQNFQKYALDKPEYKYLKMGYFFGWK